jgi:hypothetical protein
VRSGANSCAYRCGMPTGVLSILGTFVSMQNARMLHYLLAKHGIPFIEPVQFAQLPFYLEERRWQGLCARGEWVEDEGDSPFGVLTVGA